MNILDVFKNTLQDGMEITKCKELSNKYKLTISYKGMSASCELNKLCTPGNEKSLCMQAIDNAMSSMYINSGDLREAEAWLHGERWNLNESKSQNSLMPDMREKVKEYITEIQEEIDRCVKLIEDKFVELGNGAAKEIYSCGIEYAKIESRIETLGQVQNDLKNRLEEVI